jgi:hypothetical protein
MNQVTELIAKTLNVSIEEAIIWQDRIESWDNMDGSEWSEQKMRRHIKAFVIDWETIYSKHEASV